MADRRYALLGHTHGPSGSVSPLTTKGDLWGYSTLDARIPIGTNGHLLMADSAQALGLKWSALSLDNLSDADTTTAAPAVGDTLKWDGTNWIPESAIDLDTIILAASPTAYWKCNEGTGTTCADATGNGNTLTVAGDVWKGPAIVPAYPSDCSLYCDGLAGQGAYAAGALGMTMPLNGDWTFECFASRVDLSLTTNPRFAELSGAGEVEADNFQFIIAVNGSLDVPTNFWEYGAGTNHSPTNTYKGYTSVPRGEPFHYMQVKDGTANTISCYVNGRLIEVLTYTQEPTGGGSSVFWIGSALTNHADFFIARAAIYEGQKLTVDDAVSHAKAGGLWNG